MRRDRINIHCINVWKFKKYKNVILLDATHPHIALFYTLLQVCLRRIFRRACLSFFFLSLLSILSPHCILASQDYMWCSNVQYLLKIMLSQTGLQHLWPCNLEEGSSGMSATDQISILQAPLPQPVCYGVSVIHTLWEVRVESWWRKENRGGFSICSGPPILRIRGCGKIQRIPCLVPKKILYLL